MKKFFTKRLIISCIICVLASVILCAVVFKLTDSFETWDPREVFARDLNEDNLLYNSYEDFEFESSHGVYFSESNGVIKIDGEFKDTIADGSTVIDVEFAAVELKAGTYTYTCFDYPAIAKYYSYVQYTGSDGQTHIVYADFSNSNIVKDGVVVEYMTFTLTEDTECSFFINVTSDNTFDNVKARPCLVEGSEEGSFYAQ